MCGFVGFITKSQAGGISPEGVLKAMADQIVHRGPDDEGYWYAKNHGVALAHRRLSIQDLSPLGAQPMSSASGRFVIAFNGEIYNFLELRADLEAGGHSFRGHSDTEVMLAGFERWGVLESLTRFVGMFAFALCDLQDNCLYLARDRMGEKPLYYGWQDETFFFGSELKSFLPHPQWKGVVNRNALTLLLRHNYIPAPHSIYEGINKLEPASLLRVDFADSSHSQRVERYWQLERFYGQPSKPMPQGERLDELDALLKQSVKQQMISDVPLGAFLSGGIDSSSIVALMQSQSNVPVKTFSIGFHEPDFNEAEHAKAVAKHLKTEHTELYVTPQQALEVIPRLPSIYDEPFADSSQIPTYLVCQMTRRQVTVALSGDGGDELFCGYERFFSYARAWHAMEQSRHSISAMAKSMALSTPNGLIAYLIKFAMDSQRHLSVESIREKLRREGMMRSSSSLQQYYRNAISYWFEPERIVLNSREPSSVLGDFPAHQFTRGPYHQMMLLDSLSYLPDDIMVKVDRAAMACSLETRVPFLDHRVVEYAARIPSDENVKGNSGKLLLKELLYRYVPRELVERPKKGFAVPVSYWLRGPLREWGEELLNSSRLEREGYFNTKVVRRKWEEHLRGRVDHSFHLWGILSFQAWLSALPNQVRI